MTAHIFLDGAYAGTSDQELFNLIVSSGKDTGNHQIDFHRKRYYNSRLLYSRVQDENGWNTYIYPEMRTEIIPFPIKIVGGILLGVLAFGIGYKMSKR